MKFNKSLIVFAVSSIANCVAMAQSAWPKIQADMYPYIETMQLIRHEQSILLGEGSQQTGLFFATVNNIYSEKLQKELISDALKKGWKLHSFVRYGTTYVLSLIQNNRILDIRLNNHVNGVDAVYSVVLNQEQVVKVSQIPNVLPRVEMKITGELLQNQKTVESASGSLAGELVKANDGSSNSMADVVKTTAR
jgi:hypothetical protein